MNVSTPSRTVEPSVSVRDLNPTTSRPISRIWLICLLVSSLTFAIGVWVARSSNPPNFPVNEAEPSTAGESTPSDEVKISQDKQSSFGLQVLEAKSEPLSIRTWRTGRLAFHDDRIAHICPPAEGLVRETPVKLGQSVKAGEILAVIESRELGQAKLEMYKARIALSAEKESTLRTQTAMANTQMLLKLLEAETPLTEIEKLTADKPIGDYRQQLLSAYTRRRQLQAQLNSQRSSGGAIPEVIILKTQAEADAASATYISLVEELRFQVKNQARIAELKLREAQTNYEVSKAKLVMFGVPADAIEQLDPIAEGANASLLTIRAPFAGTIVEKHAVRSERVDPEAQMFVLADLSVLWVQADIYEADLRLLRGLEGKSVTIRSELIGVDDQKAKVTYTGDLIDKSSRTLTLTADLDNPDRRFKPGLFVDVGIDSNDPIPVVQIPVAAVMRHENKPFVFLQTSQDTFQRVEVTLGRSNGDRVEIVRGIQPGDRVVVQGGFVLKSELLKDQMVGE